MRKDLGIQPALVPMPVLMVAAYDEDGVVNVMNAAWGTACDMDKVALIIDEDHKTTKNIRAVKAFTGSIADRAHMEAADFFGIATGNTMPDKFARSGCHAEKSENVNAPIITEFPVTLECELAEIVDTENLHAVVGKIVNVSADEAVLSEKRSMPIAVPAATSRITEKTVITRKVLMLICSFSFFFSSIRPYVPQDPLDLLFLRLLFFRCTGKSCTHRPIGLYIQLLLCIHRRLLMCHIGIASVRPLLSGFHIVRQLCPDHAPDHILQLAVIDRRSHLHTVHRISRHEIRR